ncbi:MAG: hypothetical protein GVY19_00095 [Bacteroidetes bacterium]|jgi:DNA-directed RNA polymerase alpha subunit|nr:hypothetical protein [Bacteroidota bacterium]
MAPEKQHNIAYLQAYLQRIERDLAEIENNALKRIEQQLHDLNRSG